MYDDNNLMLEALSKDTKPVARYTDHGSPQEHCGNCRHFMLPSSCARVIGNVVQGGWCKHWEKA